MNMEKALLAEELETRIKGKKEEIEREQKMGSTALNPSEMIQSSPSFLNYWSNKFASFFKLTRM